MNVIRDMGLIDTVATALTNSATSDPLKTYVQLAGIASAVAAVGTAVFTRTLPWLFAKLQSRSVQHGIGSEYSLAGIERSIRYYIRPDCQDIDPAGGDEPRLVYGVCTPLFAALDDVLSRRTEFRHLMLLADSGMGKTSALINYYSRHMKKVVKPFDLAMVPLSTPDADKKIAAVENKRNTVLLLDALDEDTLAIVDHTERVRLLLELTREFRKIVITCRTQFFSRDEEIPTRTGILKVGARAAGEHGEFMFHKLYLSPFSDSQVLRYLKKLYPVWRWQARRDAVRMAKSIKHLSARPMLLAHIDDLIKSDHGVTTSAELYEEMVAAWIQREDALVKGKDQLAAFSEKLAADIYLERQRRGAERISADELSRMAKHWSIELEDWKLSGRSLLNRDSEGNFKFAHRSIMEYLFIQQFLKGDMRCLNTEWTDQMRQFYLERFLGGGKEISNTLVSAEILVSYLTPDGVISRSARLGLVPLHCTPSAFNRMKKIWSHVLDDEVYLPLTKVIFSDGIDDIIDGKSFDEFLIDSAKKLRPPLQPLAPLGWFSRSKEAEDGFHISLISKPSAVADTTLVTAGDYAFLKKPQTSDSSEYVLFLLNGTIMGCRDVPDAQNAARLLLALTPDKHKAPIGQT